MISTRNLAYRHTLTAGAPWLHFDDVDVPAGGRLLLRGPSGSGKSTWLALAAGLLRPAAGEITVAGQVLGHLGAAQSDAWRARSIGFLPQKLHLSAALTVYDNLALAYWAASQPVNTTRIMQALQTLDVQDLAERKPHTLSGGQAQRVALARAILCQPSVILADEPTASLDDEAASSALALLHSTAQASGASLVMATHDARAAAFFNAQKGLQSLCLKRQTL